jgi:two-component system, chemotaxis family, response regulator PixG
MTTHSDSTEVSGQLKLLGWQRNTTGEISIAPMIIEPVTNNSLSKKLSDFKSALFTGKLSWRGQAGQQWYIYFYLGRILYASGGNHGVRRWLRSLSIHCFAADTYQPDSFGRLTDISPLNEYEILTSWEYFLLVNWVRNNRISRQNAITLIQAVITEVIFEINQSINSTCEVMAAEQLNPQLALFDTEHIWADGMRAWQSWQAAQLSTISPDQSPIISQPEMIQQDFTGSNYAALATLLDGKRSLREIAAQTRRSVLEVSSSLLPYIQKGGISLVNIPDFVSPAEQYFSDFHQSSIFFQEMLPLIACIDSQLICHQMKEILGGAGFQFLGITDATKAVSTVVAKKPVLIFLDSAMPGINGYEICNYIHKMPRFQQIPIVMLAAHDGMVERMRAKMAGATDVMAKNPTASANAAIDPQAVLQLVQKYTHQLN